jgi:hypothetical protein
VTDSKRLKPLAGVCLFNWQIVRAAGFSAQEPNLKLQEPSFISLKKIQVAKQFCNVAAENDAVLCQCGQPKYVWRYISAVSPTAVVGHTQAANPLPSLTHNF